MSQPLVPVEEHMQCSVFLMCAPIIVCHNLQGAYKDRLVDSSKRFGDSWSCLLSVSQVSTSIPTESKPLSSHQMDGFRTLAHEAAGLPPFNLDLDGTLDADTRSSLPFFTPSSPPEPPLQEFGIVSWADDTFSSWGITTIPQPFLKSQASQDLLAKPVPLLPVSTSVSSRPSGPLSGSGSGSGLGSSPPPTRPPSVSSNAPSGTTAIATAAEPKQPQAFLRLIHIPYSPHDRALLISPRLLLRLFKLLHLDAHALYLFHTFTPGFHALSSGPSSHNKRAPPDGQVLRFYLSSNDVTTIWSYNVHTRTTLGVCLVDEQMGYKFNVVKYHIEQFKSVLASPVCMAVADVARGVVWKGEGDIAFVEEGRYDGVSRRSKGGKGREKEEQEWEVEEQGGWKASDKIYTPSMELSPVLMETLSRRCRVLGRVITKAQEAKSSLRLSLRIARQLTSRKKLWRKLTLTLNPSPSPSPSIGTSPNEASEAFDPDPDPLTASANAQIRLLLLSLIIPQLKARIFGWTCRQKEAIACTNVLMARISRTDAHTNHREASSMRVIAVMTMAFLPATFFATLFALPAFQWEVIDGWNSPQGGGRGGKGGGGGRGGGGGGDGGGDDGVVVQTSFWIWVAFSVPMTLLVFVVCGVTSSSWWDEWRRKGWWRRVTRLGRWRGR